ncbi:EAL domain-containing protein [Sphingomonas bacterium]|uniref:EAL domain-containing protein n=1 Tax=Sphingomonas bacterium TaxID=1895847 RepID=UPI0015768051|nr:EAL domain-containing protein [Sphingomonas bacterium]
MTTRSSVQIWSPDAAEALAAIAQEAGWDVSPSEHAAAAAIIDARLAEDGAIAVLREGATPWQIALVSEADPAAQDRLIAAGANQIAVVGADGAGLAQALRLAGRARPVVADRREVATDGSPRLAEWIDDRLAAAQPIAIVHVALLRLDLVNAALGRSIGTALTNAAERRIAAQVSAVAEDDGMVARITGPGFAAVIAGAADRAVTAAARIEEALARRFRLDDLDVVLGVRLGLIVARAGEGGEALVARAVAASSPVVAAAADDPLAVDVHLALTRGEIAILFQPQARMMDGEVSGVEALARWRHPRLGELGAEALLAAADRAGIGIALSEHIQRAVLDQVAAWPPRLARLRVALNLTAADLARPGFIETLLAHIDASGVSRERLTLEITETELMADLDAAAAVLGALQAAGCRIAIDDFGTGYSSLAYLASLPIDYLKIDRSLVGGIEGDNRAQVVVRGAIDMARSLGLTVIAEGVETAAQRDLLAATGCAVYQGFLLAPPLDEAALMALVGGG